MNILYISSSIIPSTNANSVHVMKMCAALAKTGNVVRLVAIKGNDLEEDSFSYYGVEPIFEIIHTSYDIKERTTQVLKSLEWADIVYTRWAWGAFLSSFVKKQKTVMEYHSVPHGLLARFLLKFNQNKCIVKNVYITQSLKNEYERKYTRKDGVVLPDGADVLSESFYEKIDYEAPLKCCYIGSFLPGKGIETVIKISQRIKNVEFYIIGGKQNEIDELKKQTTDNVKWFGYLSQNEIKCLSNDCQIGLLPNKTKVLVDGKKNIGPWTSPLKLFEYMAQKKAILASNIPVLTEVLENERNCLLIEAENINAWVEAIAKLEKDRTLLKKLSECAYDDLVNKYSWDKRAEYIVDFLSTEI